MLPSYLTAILSAVGAAIPIVFGWMALRVVKGIDGKIESLGEDLKSHGLKLEALAKQDTSILIQLEGLRARVSHIEYLTRARP